LGAKGKMGVSTGNTLPRKDLGAGDELDVATGNSPQGPGLGAKGKMGVSTGNTLPRKDLGAGDECSGLLIPDTDLGENPRRERGV
ncbi:hypothetical protein ACPTJ6_29235, partial [Pseudomonas aeruginosa]